MNDRFQRGMQKRAMEVDSEESSSCDSNSSSESEEDEAEPPRKRVLMRRPEAEQRSTTDRQSMESTRDTLVSCLSRGKGALDTKQVKCLCSIQHTCTLQAMMEMLDPPKEERLDLERRLMASLWGVMMHLKKQCFPEGGGAVSSHLFDRLCCDFDDFWRARNCDTLCERADFLLQDFVDRDGGKDPHVARWDQHVTRFLAEDDNSESHLLEVVKDPALLERIERGKARRKGLYSGGARCPACHAPGLETTSRQARAGDEGRTVQVSCPSCHYSKTFNT